MAWLLIFIPFIGGFWALFNYWTWLNELKAYLEDEEINPVMDVVLALVCFLYALYLPIKLGGLIQRAQVKAGHADAQDQGIMFLVFCLLCGFGFYKMQDELNKAWA